MRPVCSHRKWVINSERSAGSQQCCVMLRREEHGGSEGLGRRRGQRKWVWQFTKERLRGSGRLSWAGRNNAAGVMAMHMLFPAPGSDLPQQEREEAPWYGLFVSTPAPAQDRPDSQE